METCQLPESLFFSFCKFKSTKFLFCSNKGKVGGILDGSWFHRSEAKQHNLMCLSRQPHKHLHLCSALSLGAVCTFSSERLHPASLCITQSGKLCKWNTIHGGRSLASGAKASASTHAAQIFAARRYYEAEEATQLEHQAQSLLQTALDSWQDLGMLFKLPLSLFPCPSLQNQLRSRDENHFF